MVAIRWESGMLSTLSSKRYPYLTQAARCGSFHFVIGKKQNGGFCYLICSGKMLQIPVENLQARLLNKPFSFHTNFCGCSFSWAKLFRIWSEFFLAYFSDVSNEISDDEMTENSFQFSLPSLANPLIWLRNERILRHSSCMVSSFIFACNLRCIDQHFGRKLVFDLSRQANNPVFKPIFPLRSVYFFQRKFWKFISSSLVVSPYYH